MQLIILNGPNINMLGIRKPNIYGTEAYSNLNKRIKAYAKKKSIDVKIYQSNHEGKLIDFIQKNYNKYDGYIINAGAYTHYSYAIKDALELIKKPIIEVHISDTKNREDFRKISVFSDLVEKQIIGKGTDGYLLAIDYFVGGLKDD